MMIKKQLGVYLFTRIVVVLTLIIILFPVLWILSVSFRTPDTSFKAYFYLIPIKATISNYIEAVQFSKKFLNVTFLEMFRNSLIVTSVSIILAVFLSSLSAFSFSNFIFPTKEVLFTVIIAAFVIPPQVLLIPLFFVLRFFKVLNTYLAVIFPYAAFHIPIATLILRGFFEQIPVELKESARIDGASNFIIFLRIALPLSKAAIATVIIFLFLEIWNEFLYALVFLTSEKIQTIPVALSKLAMGRWQIPIHIYTASIMITIVPVIIIFVIFQKWFIRGITMGALKG